MAIVLKTDIREVPLEQVAAKLAVLEMQGVGENKQVTVLTEEFEYPFTRTQLNRLRIKDTYLNVIEDYKKNVVKKAVSDLKGGVSSLVPKIIKALEVALDEGNLQAVMPALKILGVESQEPTQQAQNLTVVLPGRQQERAVNDKKDEPSGD